MTSPIKFDWTINFGHMMIIASAMLSVFVAYTNIVRSQDNHSFRIEALERSRIENTQANREVLNTLSGIKEDIAALKVQIQNQR